jgi:competence protein ComEA
MSLFKNFVFFLLLSAFLPLAHADAVNINHADAQTIAMSLKGVGLKKAEAIVQYRAQNGPFRSIEDLTQVKGIGVRTLDLNRKNILIQEVSASKN